MAQLRPGGWPRPPDGWQAQHHWVHDLGADSLELMGLTSALADAVRLRDIDAARSLYAQPTWGHWLAVAAASLDAHGHEASFRTSGSTGTPKSCRHPLAHLTQEMRALAPVLTADATTPVQRIVSAVRSHHIYGFLFTVLLPHVLPGHQGLASGPLPVLDLQGEPPALAAMQLRAGDLVIGFPDWWRALARAQPTLPPGVIGVTSTAPCPDEVCEAVRACGLSRLLHMYGSSETAGIGWRNGGDAHGAGYTLLPFWQRDPALPQALRRTLPNGHTVDVTLQDELSWLTDGRFVPGPRRDGAVQVGGVNVHLGAVRQKLLTHPGVADVALRLHDVGGIPRLKAFVVPRETDAQGSGVATDVEALSAWSRQHLAPAARPVHYTFGPTLPVNAMGKACDWVVVAQG